MAKAGRPRERIEPVFDGPERAVARGKAAARPKGAAAGGKRRKRTPAGWAARVRRGLYWMLVAGIWLTVVAGGVIAFYGIGLPGSTNFAVPDRPPNIRIVAANGQLIANRGDTGGENVRIKDLPPYLAQAVIAIEDRRFYNHVGIDPIGLVRALVSNLGAGTVVQGGSTLTQQLAKNLFLTPDRTVGRKIQEAILAVWLEAKYTKAEILEMYLNRVYLGGGAYGVDAAARRYFAKSARNLNLQEAAILAGLLKAPSRYSPSTNPTGAEGRAQLVLAAMRREGFIGDRETALAMAVTVEPPKDLAGGSGSYVADWVMDTLPGLLGAVDDDITVDTTIDLGLQAEAAAAIEEGIARDGKTLGLAQGALVAMDRNGAVKALVGGRDYRASQFDRAVEAKRQPGSAFKPFVYLTALEAGLTPDTVRVDGPVTIKGWRPQNYDKDFLGLVTLRNALALSINTVSAQLADEVGPGRVAATARRLGIGSTLRAIPSIALGTSEVSLLELTGAYVPFANGGQGVIPHVIKRVRTAKGKVLYERKGSGPGRVIQPQHLGMMNAMLRAVVNEGTGRRAAIRGFDIAGKTGTSQDWRDAWFVGYTADLVAGVWFGNDDGAATRKASGGTLPAATWNRFMTAALKGVAVADLPGNPQFRDAGRATAPPQTLGRQGEDGPVDGPPPVDEQRAAATRRDREYQLPPGVYRPPGGGSFAGSGLVPPADIGSGSPRERGRGLLDRLFGG